LKDPSKLKSFAVSFLSPTSWALNWKPVGRDSVMPQWANTLPDFCKFVSLVRGLVHHNVNAYFIWSILPVEDGRYIIPTNKGSSRFPNSQGELKAHKTLFKVNKGCARIKRLENIWMGL
jgi:hypothetical protein